MKIEFLPEPELEFGVGRHIDIRFGLMHYGPVDFAHLLAPREIRVGIVGTNETVEGVERWLESCRHEIPAKTSKQPNLFPKFPGFQADTGFQSSLVIDSRLQRTILQRLFDQLTPSKDVNQIISQAVDLFLDELKYLTENTKVDVLICAVPQVLLNVMDPSASPADETTEKSEEETPTQLNFHHLLKARAMDLKIPIQLIVPSTYDEKKARRQKRRPDLMRRLQDEATRAWNFHTALYYKAKGVPWRLPRDPEEYVTCYVGVSFYKSLDESVLLTSVAQIFNERGEGVVVRGGPAKISKDDRQVHLEEQDAERLLDDALALYKNEHKNYPARVVIHKSSTYTTAEITGFLNAAQTHQIDLIDLISLDQSTTRLFRLGSYPPLRGVLLSPDERTHVLYTRGSVDFFSTYPGLYIPRPLLFRCEYTEHTPRLLAEEILALTKMNWNNTQFDGRDPITLRAARQVSAILKYVREDDYMASSYRFYM